MENTTMHHSGYSVYPGEYVPLLREEEVREELKRSHKEAFNHPPVNVTELAQSYKIEVAIPGVKREEFLIQIDENILSVNVLHKKSMLPEVENFQLHEFDYECFDRNIILPENVDAEFVSAEYRSGILRLHLTKTNHPAKNFHTQIVVY